MIELLANITLTDVIAVMAFVVSVIALVRGPKPKWIKDAREFEALVSVFRSERLLEKEINDRDLSWTEENREKLDFDALEAHRLKLLREQATKLRKYVTREVLGHRHARFFFRKSRLYDKPEYYGPPRTMRDRLNRWKERRNWKKSKRFPGSLVITMKVMDDVREADLKNAEVRITDERGEVTTRRLQKGEPSVINELRAGKAKIEMTNFNAAQVEFLEGSSTEATIPGGKANTVTFTALKPIA